MLTLNRRRRAITASIRRNPWDYLFVTLLALCIALPIVGLTIGPAWLRFAYSPLIIVMLIASELGRRRDDRLARDRLERQYKIEAGMLILDAFDRGYEAGGKR